MQFAYSFMLEFELHAGQIEDMLADVNFSDFVVIQISTLYQKLKCMKPPVLHRCSPGA